MGIQLEMNCVKNYENDSENNSSFLHGDESGANQCEGVGRDKPNSGTTECKSSHSPEKPPPPSEWLEDTLIDLYLSGYSSQVVRDGADETTSSKVDEVDNLELQADGDNDAYTS